MRAPETLRDEIPVGPELIEVAKIPIEAKVPFLVQGPSGCGKSEILEQIAAALGIRVFVLNVASLELGDLIGLPRVVNGRTTYALPFWCPVDGEGLLIFAELNRADRLVKNPLVEFFSSRKMHGYVLPDGWSIAGAINPDTSEYDTTGLDYALRKRFLTLDVRADRKTWLRWARRNRIHPAILALAHGHERIFETVPPRTWTNTSKLLDATPADRLRDKRFVRMLLTSELGQGWVSSLIAELSRTEAGGPSVSEYDVLRDFGGSGAELALARFEKEGATDRIDELTTRIEDIVSGPELAELDAREEFCLDSFEALLRVLPGDQRERLQHGFALNHEISANMFDPSPDDLIEDYAKRSVHRPYRVWLRDPHLQHRAWSVGWAVPERLQERSDVQELKSNESVRKNLAKLVTDLAERAEPVLRGLRRVGFAPLFPTKGTAA